MRYHSYSDTSLQEFTHVLDALGVEWSPVTIHDVEVAEHDIVPDVAEFCGLDFVLPVVQKNKVTGRG